MRLLTKEHFKNNYNPKFLSYQTYVKYVENTRNEVKKWALRSKKGVVSGTRVIDLMREEVARMITSKNPTQQQMGVVFYLMDTMHARIGGDASDSSEAVGITRWQKQHLKFEDDKNCTLAWDFIGKAGMR